MDPDQVNQMSEAPEFGIGGIIGLVIGLAFVVLMIASIWKMFVKAGEPGWACIVPIYNLIVSCKIAGKPVWWFILLFIPFVGIIFAIMLAIATAEKFGKGAGFGIGLAFLPFIFYPILGFGDAVYIGPKTP
jgi:hypothetical protein